MDANKAAEKSNKLHVALESGDKAGVISLLEGGFPRADINTRNEAGETPLQVAMRTGATDEIILKLLAAKADPIASSNNSYTPLGTAIHSQYSDEVLTVMIKRARTVNWREYDHKSLLQIAISENSSNKVILALIGRRANPLPDQNKLDKQPLLRALEKKRDISIIRSLIKAGADTQSQDDTGRMSLHYAIKYCSEYEIIKEILLDCKSPNIKDFEGESPLHYAVTQGSDSDVIKLLLRNEARILVWDRKGQTPFDYALQKSDSYRIIDVFLNHISDIIASRTSNQVQDGLYQNVIEYFKKNNQNTEFVKALTTGVLLLLLTDQSKIVQVDKTLKLVQTVQDLPKINGRSILHIAVENFANYEVMHSLLKHGANVYSRDAAGRTPLHLAIDNNSDYTVIDLMLRYVNNYTKLDFNGDNLLSYTLRAKSVYSKLIKSIIDAGAEINIQDDQGRSPLYYAIESHTAYEVIHELVSSGADVSSVDNNGATPLHYAASICSAEQLSYLIRDGAPVNIEDNFGVTPIQYAIDNRCRDVLIVLLATNAEFSSKQEHDICQLIKQNHPDNEFLSTVLVWRKQAKNRESNPQGSLIRAVYEKMQYSELYFHLLAPVISLNECVDDYGNHMIHIASRNGDLNLVDKLVSFGADINSEDDNGRTALHHAVIRSTVSLPVALSFLFREQKNDDEKIAIEMVRKLIEKGADVRARDKEGISPLHIAVGRGFLQVSSILLNAGAYSNERMHDGTTPLHIVARSGSNVTIIKRLLEAGADPKLKTKNGDNVIDYIYSNEKMNVPVAISVIDRAT